MGNKFFLAIAILCVSRSAPAYARTSPADTLNVIDEAVVTGTRAKTLSGFLPQTISVVNYDQLAQTQRISILPTLDELVPGMFVTSRAMLGYGVSGGAAGGISIRGLAGGSGQMMVLIDGHPQYQGIFGHPISDSYQTMMTERVEVLRGPASVLYGSNAMGGVINIITRKSLEDGMHTDINLGAGSYGTVEGSVTNRFRDGKFSSVVSGQYSRSDNHRPRMGFEQYGGFLKLAYDFSDHWDACFDGDVTHFNSSYPGPVSGPLFDADQWITRAVLTLAVNNHYEKTEGSVSLYHNFGFHKINDGHAESAAPQKNLFRSKDALSGVSAWQSAHLFQGNTTTVGFDFQNIYGKAWNQVIETGDDLDPMADKTETEVAGYVDFRQDLTPWLTVDAGVRVDYHSVSHTEVVPQGGLAFRILGGELKAMVSKGFRRPTIKDMYLFRPANPELEPERLWNYELAWKQSAGNVSYGVNLFYLKGDNVILTQMGESGPLNVNSGAIENYGAEADFNWRISGNWNLMSNISALHMENKIVGAPEFKAYLGVNYHNGPFSITAGGRDISNLYTVVGAEPVKENFFLLSLNASYKILDWLSLWARGDNLLAQKYEINAGYPMPRATFMSGISISF